MECRKLLPVSLVAAALVDACQRCYGAAVSRCHWHLTHFACPAPAMHLLLCSCSSGCRGLTVSWFGIRSSRCCSQRSSRNALPLRQRLQLTELLLRAGRGCGTARRRVTVLAARRCHGLAGGPTGRYGSGR